MEINEPAIFQAYQLPAPELEAVTGENIPVPKKTVQVSKAPPPITPIRGMSGSSALSPKRNCALPNWAKWKYMPEVEAWEACALALNIDPDKMERSPQNWMANSADIFLPESFPSDDIAKNFKSLMDIVKANKLQTVHFKISLPEFAAWCTPVVRDLTGHDIAPKLAALQAASIAGAAIGQAKNDQEQNIAPHTEQHAKNQNEQPHAVSNTTDDDQTLADLFEPVRIQELAKMFPTKTDGMWKTWQERASRNGLKNARDGRAMFNPYKAGVWFLKQKQEGWDMARLYRTLANNLPPRSRDKKYLLVDED